MSCSKQIYIDVYNYFFYNLPRDLKPHYLINFSSGIVPLNILLWLPDSSDKSLNIIYFYLATKLIILDFQCWFYGGVLLFLFILNMTNLTKHFALIVEVCKFLTILFSQFCQCLCL